MTTRRNWTREEVIVALALYLSRPFGSIHSRNPDVQAVAEILNRSPGAVARKIGNLAYYDDQLTAKGLSHTARIDQEVWEEFIGDRTGLRSIEAVFKAASDIAAHDFDGDISFLADSPGLVATERLSERKERLYTGFFRATVISNFDGRCAVSGLRVPQLIEAAHILSWAEREDLRLVPANGLALCTILHRAYDADLLGIDPDGLLHVSKQLKHGAKDSLFEKFFNDIDASAHLRKGKRYNPNPAFLDQKFQTFLVADKNGISNERAAAFLSSIRR